MKVALIGAQSTGKTTLLNNLRPEYKDLLIGEIIREAAAADPTIKINENGDERSQRFFFDSYCRIFDERDNFISDRGPLDVVAYTKWLCTHGPLTRRLPSGVYFNMFAELVSFTKRNPDVAYVYMPIMFDAVDDGFRSANEKYRKQVDKNIKQVIKSLEKATQPRGLCPFYVMTSNTLEDRIVEFENFLTTIQNKENLINN